ncbi:type II/IV secretion system protein [bacterium SCSIO 12696]|nr:type II/IV secretion system protein [bacterium SCSIO 12696]
MAQPSAKPQRLRLGDLLVEKQLITEPQLMDALQAQKNSGLKLGKQLIELGLVQENELLGILSQQLNIPFIDLANYPFENAVVNLLPEAQARRHRVVVLEDRGDSLLLGMADPTDIFCLDDLAKVLNRHLEPAVVRESQLLDIVDVAYCQQEEIAHLAEQLHEELEESAVDLADIATDVTDSDAPVVKMLQKIFEDALRTKASDIHIEPDETVLRIRQRIDGVLSEQVMNEKSIAGALVVRLKLMSELDISEKRLPQDGRFNLKVSGRSIDVRLSTMPVQWGESVVMRLLDHSQGILGLEKVGMPQRMIDRVRHLLHRPNGLVLVTGPTGSGKTTTLYGGLTELNTPDRKIITVEDPVEYRLPRISQVQINHKIDLSFAKVLKATLRQDPDVLLVGEIRDRESAEIALRAAMTGHLVLSTLHTNDAITSALRLTDMGVDPYLVSAALKGVLAQRLVRKVCEHCAEPYEPDANELQLIKSLSRQRELENLNLRKGRGCVHCFNTGYRGRIGVFELLEIDRDMADALRENDIRAFNQAVHDHRSFRPLNVSALGYAAEGITTLSEVMRVSAEVDDTGEDDEQ